uniref:coiled-coil domain-containing protein 137-like n=1 Tax=Styela clava TaxID=7725 RepID=UPI00193AA793|nr:coiled-coil domain-containing protein 137-like [Styela clava]
MGMRHRFKKQKPVGSNSSRDKNSKNPDVSMKQRIPRTFTEMMEMKELYKGSDRQIKKKLKERAMKVANQEEIKRKENAERKRGESKYRHMQRLASAVEMSMEKAKQEIQEFPEKEIDKKEKPPPPKKIKTKERLTKLKEKKNQAWLSKLEEKTEKDRWIDHVEFGEVVMRPPTITSKPRKAGEVKKPGQRDLLFLKKGFGTSKKSNLSLARTKALNDERERVIQAYRDIKRTKMNAESK